jgi:hypothetical protein
MGTRQSIFYSENGCASEKGLSEAELRAMKISQLYKRAQKFEASEEELEAAMDDPDNKSAFIELIISKEAACDKAMDDGDVEGETFV